MRIELFDSVDIPHPADRCVAQALASRSLKPFGDHLAEINKDKTTNFMEKFVIGFNHDNLLSTADGIVISLSGISMLAAKAIEDSSLFNGQESSTRYIDFSNQAVVSNTDEGEEISKKNMEFFASLYEDEYRYNLENTNQDANDPNVQKAIKAKTFDIVRAFLPVGLTTNVNWCTNLRQAQEHVYQLLASEHKEMVAIGWEVLSLLENRYPESIFPLNHSRLDHMKNHRDEYLYYEEDPTFDNHSFIAPKDVLSQDIIVSYDEADLENINNYASLKTRPRGCPPPRIYSSLFAVSGSVDFGSFRDLQRHRNNMCKTPKINTSHGFEPWYIKNLSPNGQKIAKDHVDKNNYDYEAYNDPYIILMGWKVPFLLNMPVEQMIYITELRTAKSVHPTARAIALGTADFMESTLPDVKIYPDLSPLDTFYLKRSQHDISEKGK